MKLIYRLLSLNLFILFVYSAALNEPQNDEPATRGNKGKKVFCWKLLLRFVYLDHRVVKRFVGVWPFDNGRERF